MLNAKTGISTKADVKLAGKEAAQECLSQEPQERQVIRL